MMPATITGGPGRFERLHVRHHVRDVDEPRAPGGGVHALERRQLARDAEKGPAGTSRPVAGVPERGALEVARVALGVAVVKRGVGIAGAVVLVREDHDGE
jgi:hypothetical protein